MIVVTGASGNVGQHVVTELAALGHPVRALARHPFKQAKQARVEWVAANFEDAASFETVFVDAERVVLVSPAHPHMQAHQTTIIDAAVRAGVRKIAKLSGLGAGPEAPIRLPQTHYAIEQHLIGSGLAYSFVRPNLFMQVLLGSAGSLAGDGAIYAPAGDGKISFTDARDVARVLAHEVLAEGNSICEITGPQALSYQDAAETLSEVLKVSARHVDVTAAQARESMLSMGMDPWVVEAFVELFGIYRAGYGSAVLSDVVSASTGSPAASLSQFATDYRDVFRRAA